LNALHKRTKGRELLDAAWERRDQSKAAIRERLPEIRKQAAKVFDDVAGILAPNR
jgi:hypothetical protein